MIERSDIIVTRRNFAHLERPASAADHGLPEGHSFGALRNQHDGCTVALLHSSPNASRPAALSAQG